MCLGVCREFSTVGARLLWQWRNDNGALDNVQGSEGLWECIASLKHA